jgi:alanine-glyoxylate transaminase/serine-glyoxylate transaminase/serine-pyruvate transaminase
VVIKEENGRSRDRVDAIALIQPASLVFSSSASRVSRCASFSRHLGNFNDLTLMGTLAGVEMRLALTGVPHQQVGVAAAMSYLAETAARRPPGAKLNAA